MKKILCLILITILALGAFAGCSQKDVVEHSMISTFLNEDDLMDYKKNLEIYSSKMESSSLLGSDKMLHENDSYYVSSMHKLLEIDFIWLHENYIMFQYDIENESTEVDVDELLSQIIVKMSIISEPIKYIENAISSGQYTKHETLTNVCYVEIKRGENEEIYAMQYKIAQEDKVFMISAPIWLVEDMTDAELMEFLTPKKVMFN